MEPARLEDTPVDIKRLPEPPAPPAPEERDILPDTPTLPLPAVDSAKLPLPLALE